MYLGMYLSVYLFICKNQKEKKCGQQRKTKPSEKRRLKEKRKTKDKGELWEL